MDVGRMIKFTNEQAPSKSPPVGETFKKIFKKPSLPGRVGWG